MLTVIMMIIVIMLVMIIIVMMLDLMIVMLIMMGMSTIGQARARGARTGAENSHGWHPCEFWGACLAPRRGAWTGWALASAAQLAKRPRRRPWVATVALSSS